VTTVNFVLPAFCSHCGAAVAIHAVLEADSDDVRTNPFHCPSCEKRSVFELPGKILFVSPRDPFGESLGKIVS
jgi:DNA-directed RNA polymerase subunit RPC12/RpoP